MTEKIIQKALFNAFYSHKYKFLNIFFFANESDWLSFLNSGFCYEVEIKVSREDFFKDFKKDRHNLYTQNEKKKKIHLIKFGPEFNHNPSWDLTAEYPSLVHSRERENYRRIGNDTIVDFYIQTSTRIDFGEIKNQNMPNKFFYAVPEGLISLDEIPDYAGLLYIDKNHRMIKVRDSKFLHKEKIEFKNRVFNKLYYPYEKQLYKTLN